jgi:membrane dipeptidase
MMQRRRFLRLVLASSALASWPLRLAALGLTEEAYARGVAFLQRHMSIDVHAHPGRFFLSRGAAIDPSLSPLASHFANEAILDLIKGHVTASCFSTVGDLASLQALPGGGLGGQRPTEPDELYRSHRLQLESLNEVLQHDRVIPILEPADLHNAQQSRQLGAVLCVEGADFLEGELSRLEEACQQGIRLITIVHYRANEIGDIQTEPERFGGLSAFGEDVVRELNRLGIVIDLAHGSKSLVKNVCALTTRPVIASHTNLAAEGSVHPRLIDAEYAKSIAGTGGLIGAWPAGIGISDFNGFIENVLRLIDAVGVDHVGIGTDMDANFQPVFDSYEDWPMIPAALLERGLAEQDVAAIMGENFARVFAANRFGAQETPPN